MTTNFSTLIEAQELADHLGTPGWVVFDCRYQLSDHEYGRRAYREGHIPGARFADMETELSGPKTPGTGRHPLPDWDTFRRWLGANGVDNDSQVIAYDDVSGTFASRLWFMLRVMGHERAAVLNGGMTRWKTMELPVDTAIPRPAAVSFQGTPDRAMLAGLEEVEQISREGGWLLVDARTPERFRGETEPMDPRAGHIPGAVNLPSPGIVNPDGTHKPPELLRKRVLEVLGDSPPESTVHYCGSGVAACHNLLVQAHVGLPLGRLYAGSWSEWCADPSRPAAGGED